jgi:iron complex outermembrane receptor protein
MDSLSTQLEIETPISETFNLLWGADYNSNRNSQSFVFLDEEFTSGGDRVFRDTGITFDFTPLYTVDSLGLFAQAQWDVTPRWLLSRGLRYDNIRASVDDYTVRFFVDEAFDVEGGSINADDVVFNPGTVYDLTNELSVFASFAQGFGVPDFGNILRFLPDEFRSFEDDLGFTAPQKVNNYELGVRGQWQAVRFSLAVFSISLTWVPLL